MKYIFRADGNAKIGVGHIMRCLTIAEALADLVGVNSIRFITSDEASAKVVNEHGFTAEILHTDYDKMEEELPQWESLNISNAVVLVDSYYVTDEYLYKIKRYGKIILLDDFQMHAFPVDVVINYNVFADLKKYIDLYGNECELYIGEKYVPIRKQFLNVQYKINDNINNIMITTGGGDIYNIAQKIYKELSSINPNVVFHIISGVFNPYYDELKQIENKNHNMIVYHDVSNMAEIMKKCELAVTAGGSTIYELAAIGVPMICFSYAENQRMLVEYIGKNISDYAGAFDVNEEQTIKNISKIYVDKMLDYRYRFICFNKETKMIDGMGAKRIARIIVNNENKQV